MKGWHVYRCSQTFMYDMSNTDWYLFTVILGDCRNWHKWIYIHIYRYVAIFLSDKYNTRYTLWPPKPHTSVWRNWMNVSIIQECWARVAFHFLSKSTQTTFFGIYIRLECHDAMLLRRRTDFLAFRYLHVDLWCSYKSR